jgi:hypothetical protein
MTDEKGQLPDSDDTPDFFDIVLFKPCADGEHWRCLEVIDEPPDTFIICKCECHE